MEKNFKIWIMFIGNSMAQYELFIRCMHYNTIRKISLQFTFVFINSFNLEYDQSKTQVEIFNFFRVSTYSQHGRQPVCMFAYHIRCSSIFRIYSTPFDWCHSWRAEYLTSRGLPSISIYSIRWHMKPKSCSITEYSV